MKWEWFERTKEKEWGHIESFGSSNCVWAEFRKWVIPSVGFWKSVLWAPFPYLELQFEWVGDKGKGSSLFLLNSSWPLRWALLKQNRGPKWKSIRKAFRISRSCREPGVTLDFLALAGGERKCYYDLFPSDFLDLSQSSKFSKNNKGTRSPLLFTSLQK